MSDDAKIAAWRDENNRFHEALVAERGEGWQAFWGSEDSQTSRYDVFLNHLQLSGAAVLDVGCGFGDFLAYADKRGVHFSRYLGVDLDARIIEGARRKRPEGEFLALDILTEEPPFRPDFIIASGIMAIGFDGYDDYVRRILRRFHGLAARGFALNFLSTRTKSADSRSHYVDPAWLLGLFQSEVDWRCVLVHDYRPNDFTLVHSKGRYTDSH